MFFKHVMCFARIMSTLCPNSCRQTARIGGGAAAPPLPPVPYAYELRSLLLLGMCVSYHADTSRIVHQSHTATCLAIRIHKRESKVRSVQRTGRSRKQLPCAIHRFLRDPWIPARTRDHRLRSAIHGSCISTDCAQKIHPVERC